MKRSSNLWDPNGPIKRNRAANQPYYVQRQQQHGHFSPNPPFPSSNGHLFPPLPPHCYSNPGQGYLGQAPPLFGHLPMNFSPRPQSHGYNNDRNPNQNSRKQSTPPSSSSASSARSSSNSRGGKVVVDLTQEDENDKDTNHHSPDDQYPMITASIMSYVRTDGQTEELLQVKFQLRAQFEGQLRRLFPNCDLFIFGSSASGFGSKSSDMDMCLVTNNNIHLKDVKLLYRIRDILCSQYRLTEVAVINAKVPILKFVHEPTKIQCDLNINNSDGVRNTHLLKFFTKCDPRFVPLVLTLKRWARHHKINDASQGTLSSYALTLLALHYLQVGVSPPILPNLIAENRDVFHPRRPLQSLSFYDAIVGDFRSQNKSTVGELFVGFLTYYSREFKYDYMGISVREARAVAKRTNQEFSKWLFIEEPYNLDNVARAVRKNYEPYIKKVIDASRDIISKAKDLESVLTFNLHPNAPMTPAPRKPANEVVVDPKAKDAQVTAASATATTATSDSPTTSAATTPNDSAADPSKSDISDLYELAVKRSFTVTFDLVSESGPPHSKTYSTRCSARLMKADVETLVATTGKAQNKKTSKSIAAKEMMKLLEEKKIDVATKETFP